MMASSKQSSRNSSKRSSKHSSNESSESHGKRKSKSKRSVSESGDEASGSSSCSKKRSKNKKHSSSKHQAKSKRKPEHLVSESGDDTSGSSSGREHSAISKGKKHFSKHQSSSNESSSKDKKRKSKSKRSASQINVESSDSSAENKKRSKKEKKRSPRYRSETRDSLSPKTNSRRSHSESRQDPIKIPSKIVPLERRCGGLKINQGEHELFQLVPEGFMNRKSQISEVKPSDSGILILSSKRTSSGISTQIDDDTSSSRSSSKVTVISTEFEETLPEIESSGILIEPYNQQRNSENTSRILRKLRLLETIDSGICSTIEEVDSSNSRVTLRSEDIPSIKYLLKQAESRQSGSTSGSRSTSRPCTPRDSTRSAFNTRSRQMKVLKPKEVELGSKPFLLSPYLSPRTSMPSSPKRIPSLTLYKDTLPRSPQNSTLGKENLTKLVAYLDRLDVRIKPEKVEQETQEPDGIQLAHSRNGQYQGLRLHPDLPINAPREQIQEFFANLPLPPLPIDSPRDQIERLPQENIRQRWQREFGEESDGNDGSDNEIEEEDLEAILDLCNDRFLKRRYRSRR